MKKNNLIILVTILFMLAAGFTTWKYKHSVLTPARPTQISEQAPSVAPTVARPQSAVRASQHAEPSGAETNGHRKFEELGILERNSILTELEGQDLPKIFQAMLDAERVEHDPMKQMGLQTTFSGALKVQKPTPEFLEQMRVFVTNVSNSQFERDLVFGALGAAATLETVKLLAELATTSPNEEVRYAATGSLGTVGSLTGGRDKLSSTLENVWSESHDEVLLMNVSQSMAKIGNPASVKLLLSSALETDGRDKVRMDIARSALSEVYLPEAVPPLAAQLINQPTSSPPAMLVAPILVKIGDAAAGKAVVNWLQARSEDATPFIVTLVRQHTRSEAMLAGWDAALAKELRFGNEKNREAIREGLTQYRAGHIKQ